MKKHTRLNFYGILLAVLSILLLLGTAGASDLGALPLPRLLLQTGLGLGGLAVCWYVLRRRPVERQPNQAAENAASETPQQTSAVSSDGWAA